eukprot:115301-Hanusia_phi.AAC.3
MRWFLSEGGGDKTILAVVLQATVLHVDLLARQPLLTPLLLSPSHHARSSSRPPVLPPACASASPANSVATSSIAPPRLLLRIWQASSATAAAVVDEQTMRRVLASPPRRISTPTALSRRQHSLSSANAASCLCLEGAQAPWRLPAPAARPPCIPLLPSAAL